MRKLVTIRRVADITPIPNKDRIVCATIDGWTIVVLKDQFNVGDPCVFFEPDCFLPTGDTRWQFLVDKKSKEFNGQTGHVLRTIRMGGVYSNGFCLTMNDCPELSECVIPDFGDQTDVTEVMGIVKYDPPEVFGRGAATKGNFPSFIPKTDEERCVSGDTKIIIRQNGEISECQMSQLLNKDFTSYEILSFCHEVGEPKFNKILGACVIPSDHTTQWFELETETGEVLKVTGNHKIWVDTISAYRRVDELKVGDSVMVF